jgi:hypothetical protein
MVSMRLSFSVGRALSQAKKLGADLSPAEAEVAATIGFSGLLDLLRRSGGGFTFANLEDLELVAEAPKL